MRRLEPKEGDMIEIKEILCPIDFSDVSRRTLQFAAATARWYGSRLTVLHVVPLTPPANVLPVVAGPLPASYGLDDSTRVQLTDEAVRFAREVAGHEVPMNVRVVEAPQVHVEIVEQAKLLPADLIIIGTHGRSGYERLFLGSVAEKVLRTATVPVLVVKPTRTASLPNRSRTSCPRFSSPCCPMLVARASPMCELCAQTTTRAPGTVCSRNASRSSSVAAMCRSRRFQDSARPRSIVR